MRVERRTRMQGSVGLAAVVVAVILASGIVWDAWLGAYALAVGTMGALGLLFLRLVGLRPGAPDKTGFWCFWVALGVRLAAAVILQAFTELTNYSMAGGLYYDDERLYVPFAFDAAGAFARGELPVDPPYGNVPFVYLLGALSLVWGPRVLMLRFWMGFVGALIAPLTYLLAREMCQDRRVAARAAWIAAVFPLLVFYSIGVVRDVLIAFFAAGAVVVAGKEWRRIGDCVVGVAALGCLYLLRTVAGIGVGLTVALQALVAHQGRRARGLIVGAGLLLVLAGTLATASGSDGPLGWLEAAVTRYGRPSTEERLGALYENRRGSATLGLARGSDVLERAFFTLRSALLPNPIAGLSKEGPGLVMDTLAGVGWYLILPFVALGMILVVMKSPARCFALWVLPAVVTLYAGTEGGVTFEPIRARVGVLPFMIALASYGISAYAEPARSWRYSRVVVLAVAGALFLIVLGYSVALVVS